MQELPQRKKHRLKDYNYSQNGAYFVTICARDRLKLFGDITIVGRDTPGAPFMQLSNDGALVSKEIEGTPLHYQGVIVDKFVVMPNHVHIIILVERNGGAPGASRPTTALIPTIIAGLKKKTNSLAGCSLWQDSYHDRIIRNEKEYQKIWEYIDTNPLKWQEDKYVV